MRSNIIAAIEYVKNQSNGVAIKDRFTDDFDPIGHELLAELIKRQLVETSSSNDTTIIWIKEDVIE